MRSKQKKLQNCNFVNYFVNKITILLKNVNVENKHCKSIYKIVNDLSKGKKFEIRRPFSTDYLGNNVITFASAAKEEV